MRKQNHIPTLQVCNRPDEGFKTGMMEEPEAERRAGLEWIGRNWDLENRR